MKAKVLMLALMGSFALSLGAQAQQEVATPNKSGHKTVFNRDRGCDHWFLEIQGGVGMLLLVKPTIRLLSQIVFIPSFSLV